MTLKEKYPLDPKKIVKKTLSYSTNLIVFAVIALFFSVITFNGLFFLIFFGLLALIAVQYFYQSEYFKTYFYDLTENGLEIKKGVIFPKSISVPMEKVSDIYVDQDFFDRLFGLYDLHFSSASLSSGTLAHIDGLNKQNCDELRICLTEVFKTGQIGAVPQAQAAGQPSAAVPAQPVVLETFKPNPMGFWVDLFAALGTTAVILLMIFPILIIAIIPLALPIAFYVKKEFESIIYEMRQDGIWVKHGWISRSETMLFYRNIQDTSIEQGIFERLVGLQNLTVKSMSFQSAASAHFSYLTADDAKKMQELLKSQIENAASSSQSAPGAQQTVQAQALASQQKAIATAAAQFSSAPLVSPYKNDFIKGHLVGSVPFLAIGFVVGILLFVISGVFGQGWLAIFGFMIIGIGILVPIIDVAMAVIDASTYSYALTSAGLEIQLGLLSRFKKVIRYEKIQDIRMSCSFFESFAGMASMEIETGSRDIVSSKQGAMDAGVTQTERIPYLKLADARALRAKLLEISGIAYPGDQNILRQTHPLSPKKPLKKTVGFVGILSVQLFILGVLMGVLGGSFLSWIGWAIAAIFAVVMIVIAPIVYKYEQMYMQKYFYDENEDSLVIRKGVFGWSEIVVPFRNIQSIYVDQDWYDVYFDTWDVWITTVTATSGPMAHIDGTSREHAESLVRILVERVEKSRKRRV